VSRKHIDTTVNTGGEMGQILDYLACSLCDTDRRKVMDDLRAALRLHAKVSAERDALVALIVEWVTAHNEYMTIESPAKDRSRIDASTDALRDAAKEFK
jgi:hypothetical protein